MMHSFKPNFLQRIFKRKTRNGNSSKNVQFNKIIHSLFFNVLFTYIHKTCIANNLPILDLLIYDCNKTLVIRYGHARKVFCLC